MTLKDIKDVLLCCGYHHVMIFSEPSYADAFIGITHNNEAVYDYDKMIEWLCRYHDCTKEEAVDIIQDTHDKYCDEDGTPIIYCEKDELEMEEEFVFKRLIH